MKNTPGTPYCSMHKPRISYLLPGVLCGILNFNCHSQPANIHAEKDKIVLASKIVLPGVSGRIDHIAYDSVNHLAFVAALGNNTVEVVNLIAGKVVHTIAGLHEPQGVVYIQSLKKIVVANGDNGDCVFFDATTYTPVGAVHLKSDADNIRYDNDSNLLYVGYASGAIAVIDPAAMKLVSNIQVDEHPESFQFAKKQDRIFINVPDANEIEVAQVSANRVIAKWKNTNASSNFPMALDEKNNRLFVGCRNRPRLRVVNAQTGKDIFVARCSGDADDVFYDVGQDLVFVSGGEGFIDIFRANDKELVQVNHIPTSAGARTSLLLAFEKKFLLAVPKHSGSPAALWVYNIQ
jgi:hypothetical protein